MSSEDSGERASAESLFADFVRRREQGEDVIFEDFCRAHPRLRHALEALYSLNVHPEEQPCSPSRSTAHPTDRASPDDTATTGTLDAGMSSVHSGGRIGPYKLLSVVGEGGFGVVYRAEQREPLRRTVALKIIKLGMDTTEVVARFEVERQALALMNHPNIAKVLDAGATAGGRPYFVMEYVPGVPITEFCDRDRLTVRQRLELFLTVCEAVQHAHQKAVIHRDIKPSNVLVTVEDTRARPMVIDFGIAKATDHRLTERTLFTEIGQMIGTPAYMSPEQAEMSGLDIDTRTDVYALGVLLYELLVGTTPFDSRALHGAGYIELQRIIREIEPPRPSTRLSQLRKDSREKAVSRGTDLRVLAGQLRGDLDWIVMRAMAKERTRRYATCSELAADIRRHLNDEPVLAGPPGTAYRLKKFLRKRRVPLTVVLCVVVLVSCVAFFIQRWTREDLRRRAIESSQRLLDEGKENLEDSRAILRQLAESRVNHEREVERLETWQPIWERDAELASWREILASEREAIRRFGDTFRSLTAALNTAPRDWPERERIEESLLDLLLTTGSAGLERSVLGSLGDEAGSLKPPPATVALHSEPAGAEVFCFRYENHAEHLVPIPFDPTQRSESENQRRRKPFLRVEKVWTDRADGCPFEAGDVIVEVNGRGVSSRFDFVRSISEVEFDETVEVTLERGERASRVDWIPFAGARRAAFRTGPLEPGRVVSIREQFGVTFAGYPLDFHADFRAGVTDPATPLVLSLPPGSYLFVLRKSDHADARYPLLLPRDAGTVRVRLIADTEVPPDMVYIPAGPLRHVEDPAALDGLVYDEKLVRGFLMRRLEVTIGEYLEFLNDPLNPLDEDGFAEPASSEVRSHLEEYDIRRVQLIPRHDAGPAVVDILAAKNGLENDSRPWRARAPFANWPVFGVSQFQALEYAHWYTVKKGNGWRYRLPTDYEWEKAARGADRRVFVWGDYPVWSFAWCHKGIYTKSILPEVVGATPIDESVYTVRDLTGSVSEHTSGRTTKRYRYTSYRGGNFHTTDDNWCHISNRQGRPPEKTGTVTGIRLVADLK